MNHPLPRRGFLRVAAALTLAAAAPGLTGCDPDAVPWNLQIAALTDDSVQMDLVPVNLLADRKEWESLSVDDYWAPESALRRHSSRLTFRIVDRKITLSAAVPGPAGGDEGAKASSIEGIGTEQVVIPVKHPIWRQWFSPQHDASALAAIGYFPASKATPGGDPRKRVIPLFKQYWDTKGRVLRVEIQDARINVATLRSDKATKLAMKLGL